MDIDEAPAKPATVRGPSPRRLAETRLRTELAAHRATAWRRLLTDRTAVPASTRTRLDMTFRLRGPERFVAALGQAMTVADLPDGPDGAFTLGLRVDDRRLAVVYEFPGPEVVPGGVGHGRVGAHGPVGARSRPTDVRRRAYHELVALLTLRAVADAFDATPGYLVDSVAFTGYGPPVDGVPGDDPPLLVDALVGRDAFARIPLDDPDLDPVSCLPGPDPVNRPPGPVTAPDVWSGRRFAHCGGACWRDPALAPDLLVLRPAEFGRLLRRLFEATGMTDWMRLSASDDELLAAAIDPDAATGGVCILLAVRGPVRPAAMETLSRTLDKWVPARGLMISTGRVDQAGLPTDDRIRIIDGAALRDLIRRELRLDLLSGGHDTGHLILEIDRTAPTTGHGAGTGGRTGSRPR